MAEEELSADTLDWDRPSMLRGLVELADAKHGIVGWAVNIGEPESAVELELLAGDSLLGSCRTHIERSDIPLDGQSTVAAGFRFEPSSLPDAGRIAATDRQAPLRVRVAETRSYLRARGELPFALEFLQQVSAAREASARRSSAAPHAVAQDPIAALERMHAAAEPIRQQPMTPASNKQVGFVEAMSGHTRGLVWLFGWMRRDMPQHFPAVIVEGRKHLAGVIVTCYERADLPADACGIVGLLRTDWRPSSGGNGPLLFFGERAERYLAAADAFAVLDDKACLGLFESLRDRFGGPFARPLCRVMAAIESWTADNARAAGIEARTHLDRILVLPGFGCLVEGWLLSPVQKVERMLLRAGDVIMAADEAATSRKPRPDLAAMVAGGGHMLDSAGFMAVFRGDIRREDLDQLVLKLVHGDGTSSNHAVNLADVRVLGESAAFEELLQLYPAAEGEAFFPALARSVSAELGRRMGEVTAFEVKTATRAVLAALSEDPSDADLIVAELALHAGEAAANGMVLLAQADGNRARTLAAYHALRQATACPCSLFFVPRVEYALYALPHVLPAVSAERFAFIGPGVFPSAGGWAAIRGALEGDDAAPLVLPIPGEIGEGSAETVVRSPECFVWSSDAFETWLAATPVLFGAGGIRALTLPDGAAPDAAACARRGRKGFPTRFSAQINAQLLARC